MHIPKANERARSSISLLAYTCAGCGTIAVLSLFKMNTFVMAFSLFAFISMAYALLRAIAILNPKPSHCTEAEQAKSVSLLSKVSILLPVYKEAHMIPDLVTHIRQTHYPEDRYEVLIICEPDDTSTIAAASKVARGQVNLFITSGEGPKTKPNALNAALPHTTGDIITVYDAEDRPDPTQLHAAFEALQNNPALAVVQAPLDYYNARQNWLTGQFALEYAALFHVWIPFLTRLNLPFPLGGTSNHIRRSALESVEGWDAYNVTEDADLSFRFAAQGWELGYIIPPTKEEAVATFAAWQHQRSRWMKGYMQTWSSHMRQPWPTSGEGSNLTAFKRMFTLQLTLGLTLLSGLLHVPGVLLFIGAWIAGYRDFGLAGIGGVFLGCLSVSYFVGILIGAKGAERAGLKPKLTTLITMPIYWLLLLPPTLQALWELWRRPFHWNKTEHGVTEPEKQSAASCHLKTTS